MGWFDEQVRARKENDRDIFEDAVFEMASAVVGKRMAAKIKDKRIVTKAAIDEILKYYHCKPVDIPLNIKGTEEQIEYALRPHGLGYREIKLGEGWYKETFGPILAFQKEDGMPVVLLPKRYGGYYYRDAQGKVARVKKNDSIFQTEAICFYRPLPMKSLKISDLLRFMKGCLSFSDYAVLIILTFAVTLVGLMLPSAANFISGFVLESGNGLILLSSAAFLLCALISSQLLTASRALAMQRLQIKVAIPMEAAMMMRLMSLPTSFFRDYSSGDLAVRAGLINKLSALLLGGVFSLGVTAISSLLYTDLMFIYAPEAAGVAYAVLVLTTAAAAVTAYIETIERRKYMSANAEESGIAYAIISGMQKIRLSGAEKRIFAKWAKIYGSCAEIEYDPPVFLKINTAITKAIPLLGMIVIYYLAVKTNISPANFLAFSVAYGTVSAVFAALAQLAASAAEIKPILEMAEPILKTAPETTGNREILTRLSGSIELSDVFFRYSEDMPYVLNGLNLKIKRGEYVAIVGKTGCGKSTLLRLLLGFETPEKGAVYYDRKDIRSLDLPALRRQMGVVMQDGSLFLGDIFSNITVSAPNLGVSEAWEAAEIAGIADDIRAMPMGMHTIIGEGQGGISGGQKQRLLIARAIAPKPKVLMFDEATSALDNKTQKQISDALDKLNCTRIVVAHRLSTIQNCDRIIVLDSGRIIEEGRYDELIQKGGFFAELVKRQQIDK